MVHKVYPHINRSFIGLTLLILSACGGAPATESPTTVVPATAAIVAATAAPVATETATNAPDGIPATYGAISMVLPAGLANGINGAAIDAVTGADTPFITPAYTQIEIGAYPLQDKFYKPKLYIFRTQDCADLQDYAAENRQRLQSILANPDAPLAGEPMPGAPFFNAMQIFAAGNKVIPFQNGRGVRFLTQYAQYYAPANNHELIYHFEGLTADGQYYIVAILPITAPLLAETDRPDAPVPTGGAPLPADYATNTAGSESYYNDITALLEATPADAFNPTLTQLDQLIQSFMVGATSGN